MTPNLVAAIAAGIFVAIILIALASLARRLDRRTASHPTRRCPAGP